MSLRTYMATGAIVVLAVAGCGDDEHGDDHGSHDSHADGGSHDDHGDGGSHDSHGDGGSHDGHGGHGGGEAGACSQIDDTVECVEDVDTVGASVTEGDVTVEVTGVMPSALQASEEGVYMLMVTVTDGAGEPIGDVSLGDVYTEAHGGHASCGAPDATEQEPGTYHVEGLAYPHGGTWYHVFEVDGEEVTLPLCVLNHGE